MPPLPTTPTGPKLQLALLVPTTGELATFGRIAQNGVFLAIDEWNAQGGIRDHYLTRRIYDTGCNIEQAQVAVHRALADGAHFIIGPLCSEAAVGAATAIETANALLISPSATHPRLTIDAQDQVRPTVFRASYGYEWQGQATARFTREVLGSDQIALLHRPTDSYAAALVEAFSVQFQEDGGQIVYTGTFDPSLTDLTNRLTAAVDSGAEMLYLPGDVELANRVGQRLNELGLAAQLRLIGSDAWESDKLDRTALAGAYFPVHFFRPNPDLLATQSWSERYKATYAVEPTALAALGYQAAGLLLESANRANSLDPTDVAASLGSSQFETLVGPLSFDPQHNPIVPITFVQANREQLTYVTTVSP